MKWMEGWTYDDLMACPTDYRDTIVAMINEEWEEWKRNHPDS